VSLHLDAIRRASDDDAPRLVFAEQLGPGPRSDLIRLQCALARTDLDDPVRPALEAKVARIAFDPAWTAAFEAAGVKMPRLKSSESYNFKPPWTFRRGFVEHVFATAETLLDHGAALADEHPIRSLALDELTVAGATALASQSWLDGVDSLSTGAPRAALAALLKSPRLHLRRLRISVDAASLRPLLALPAVARLRALDVDVRDDRAAAAIALAESAPETLEELRLDSRPNNWGSATGQRTQSAKVAGAALSQLLRAGRLSHLRALAVDALDASAVQALREHPALEDVSASTLPDEVGALLVSDVLPKLRRLRLQWVGPRCGESLASARADRLVDLELSRWRPFEGEQGLERPPLSLRAMHAPELRRLRLRDCGFDRVVVEGLCQLSAPCLTSVALTDTRNLVSAAPGAVESLVKAPLVARLISLSIDCADASLADARAVAAASLPELRRLSISTAPRGEQADLAIRALADSSGFPELRHLYFLHAGNLPSFGTDGAEALLARDSELAILYVNPTGLAPGVRKKLEQRYAVYPGATWTSDRLPFVSHGYLATDATES
jgi:uncharacterized protein (TIGR02996 family)